jgi:tRNA(Ile)-lysidine synthase
LQQLLNSKNLLAFSGGIDSTALFFILLAQNIKFDIAIVDYGLRDQSKKEVAYAKKLCKLYNKQCFLKEFPKDTKFSEKIARDFRYKFFEEIITNYKYQNLLTGHQLNDKFEWFLMQMSKGAGVSELIGLEEKENRVGYTLVRPLLNHTKDELQEYLDDKQIKYFIDQSNFDNKYKRNEFRHNYSDKFLKQYSSGVKRSFEYLAKDKNSLFKTNLFNELEELKIFNFIGDDNIAIRIIDKELKLRGILISKATRDEILIQREIIISNKIAIAITQDKIWIAPKCDITMSKDFKERCRIKKIPKNMRSYLFTINYNLQDIFPI